MLSYVTTSNLIMCSKAKNMFLIKLNHSKSALMTVNENRDGCWLRGVTYSEWWTQAT